MGARKFDLGVLYQKFQANPEIDSADFIELGVAQGTSRTYASAILSRFRHGHISKKLGGKGVNAIQELSGSPESL
jgi:hypothetical protein